MSAVEVLKFWTVVDVLHNYPMLSERELRQAMRAKQIDFFKFKTGVQFTPSAVQDFIKRKYMKCAKRKESGRIETITSSRPIPIVADTGTPADMTKELEKYAEEALKRLTRGKQKQSSSA